MAKAVRTIGIIAGAVALVATGVGAFAAAGSALAGTASTVATIATITAGVANVASTLLTKPPPVRGSVTQSIIDAEPPSPYLMGEGFFAGVMRHRVGYGGVIDDTPNPYLMEVYVYSVAGPVEQLVAPLFSFAAPGSFYTSFFAYTHQLGEQPEASALALPFGTSAPGHSPAHKLSGQAAIAWGHKFDKKGKRYASGLPPRGAIWRGVRVYDPRKDSTFPGGSGLHRVDDETTWEYSEIPALHAGTYALGRYSNGTKIFGVGLPPEGIDWEVVAAWANDCEANGWTMFGVVFEPGDRWVNLRDIAIAGGAEPLFSGAVLGFHWSRPRVALDTVTQEDLTEDPAEVTKMTSYRDRLNGVVPRYRSPAHNWELIAGTRVGDPAFEAEDGEARTEEVPFNFVKDPDQAAQLAAYWLYNRREVPSITLTCKPRLRAYRPGDCLHLDLPELDLDTDAVIIRRSIDPASMKVTLVLMGETAAKHAYALGETTTPPPVPVGIQTPEERDAIAAAGLTPAGYERQVIATSSQSLVTISATDSSITIGDHDRIYVDEAPIAVTGATLTEDDAAAALTDSTLYYLYYDDAARAGGAVAWKATTDFFTAQNSASNPARHYAGYIATDAIGGGGSVGGGALPSGSGGTNPYQ